MENYINPYITLHPSVSNKTGEPLFVYFRSDTCGWCKKFEEESYTNSSIQKNITRSYGVHGTPHELFLYANGSEIKRLPEYVDNKTLIIRMTSTLDIIRTEATQNYGIDI